MADPHQVNIIIATAICDACGDHPDRRMDPEEAKQIAKRLVEALADAGQRKRQSLTGVLDGAQGQLDQK
jgi:hypothetical protein